MHLLAFDLETTGLHPERDRIVEFSFISLDEQLGEQERWSQRVHPGVPIPAQARDIHGISDADVAELPRFEAFADRIQALIEDRTLVAYNHLLDRDMLHYELLRAGRPGIPVDQPVIDPFLLYRRHRPHTLEGAVRHYLDRSLEDAHTAEGDAAATVDVLRAQLEHPDLPANLEALVEKPDRQYLDRARRVYEHEDGSVRFAFGKHRDRRLIEHEDYARWMLAADFPMETKRIVSDALDAASPVHMTERPAASDGTGATTPARAASSGNP
ncbi:MAG: 3'-5' exonuclease [Thermoplasmatota archaeon]